MRYPKTRPLLALLLIPLIVSAAAAEDPNKKKTQGKSTVGSGEDLESDPSPAPTTPTNPSPTPLPAPVPGEADGQDGGSAIPSGRQPESGRTGDAARSGSAARPPAAASAQVSADGSLNTRVGAGMSQRKLQDRLAPLMHHAQDSGEFPDGGAVLATPVSLPSAGRAAAPGAAQNGWSGSARQSRPPLDSALRQRDYAQAERALTEQLAAHPDDGGAFRLRAITRRMEKDYSGALADAGEAIRIDPNDGWSRDVRALTLSDLKRYPEALDEAGAALRINRKDARALAARASAWKGLGRRKERLADLKEAASLDPQFASLYERALADADDGARTAPPGNPEAWVMYGSGGAGALLLLAGAWLFFCRTGNTVSRSRAPMRLADRLPARAPAVEGFEVIRQVGEGGMGIVYEAVDRALKRKVALKRLRDGIASDPRERRRFLREASTVASLKHPDIVQIHSAFEADGGLFLVFEYVSGESLSSVLKHGQLGPAEALRLLRPIARALDYAHSKGVIHQDLKPANIMVFDGGAKVMDFGIARRQNETATQSTTTRNEIVGTPAYMAPEQEAGQPVPQSDLFALGVCAYEMLSGRRPFDPRQGLMPKIEGRFIPLSTAAPGVPGSIDEVLAKALNPRPQQRHPSASDFLSGLERSILS